jgi:hypothetical protein
MCHTGTAHGWKNKAFLVNLNDLGPELNKISGGIGGGALGGEIDNSSGLPLAAGANVPKGTHLPYSGTMNPVPTGYSNGPYYRGALLRINAPGAYAGSLGFNKSGNWQKGDCSTSGCH